MFKPFLCLQSLQLYSITYILYPPQRTGPAHLEMSSVTTPTSASILTACAMATTTVVTTATKTHSSAVSDQVSVLINIQ